MKKSVTAVVYIYLIFSLYSLVSCAPLPQTDNELDNEDALPKLINQGMDYNTVVGHFKDLFMFLPVMFTTLRETMTGFPKFAEGLRMLHPNSLAKEDCHCKKSSEQNGNDISKSGSQYL